MNNALIGAFEMEEAMEPSRLEALRKRDSELVRMIEALDTLIGSVEWSTLKELEFGRTLENIESRIQTEAGKPEVNLPEIYRLQGERKWARKYSKLEELRHTYHNELVGIRKVIAE